MKDAEGKPVPWKGQAITPEHLSKVQQGDIVLMHSPYRGKDMPYLAPDTTAWLAKKGIKMLAVQLPGLAWEASSKLPPPHNSPTHRNMLGNNIPITYPLANMELLKKDRVIYIGLPLSVENMDASWIRAIALEEI
jgi:kynurenine formamidase